MIKRCFQHSLSFKGHVFNTNIVFYLISIIWYSTHYWSWPNTFSLFFIPVSVVPLKNRAKHFRNSSTGTLLQYGAKKPPPVSNRKELKEESMTHKVNELEWPFVWKCWQVNRKMYWTAVYVFQKQIVHLPKVGKLDFIVRQHCCK